MRKVRRGLLVTISGAIIVLLAAGSAWAQSASASASAAASASTGGAGGTFIEGTIIPGATYPGIVVNGSLVARSSERMLLPFFLRNRP